MNIDQLPTHMQTKVVPELCRRPGLPGFCWSWQNCINSKGYACVGVNGKVQLAHRVSYELLVGPIPAGLQIDHLCQNKKCINPEHLEPVTDKVNKSRTDAATKLRCVHGHPLAGPNVRTKSKGKRGTQRQCCVCEMDMAAARTERNRKGLRQTRPEVAARRAVKRQWLLDAGELALREAVAS